MEVNVGGDTEDRTSRGQTGTGTYESIINYIESWHGLSLSRLENTKCDQSKDLCSELTLVPIQPWHDVFLQ